MITATISAYLCFRQLDEYKTITRKGVTTPRKQPRYDLTLAAGYWSSLEKLKNYKGIIFLNLIPTEDNAARKKDETTPEYYLQVTPAKSKAINLSGIRFLYQDGKQPVFGCGEPSDQPKLKGGIVNPMYESRHDGFLFLFSDDLQQLEVLVIENGRTLIDAYRKQLAMGGFDSILAQLRSQAKIFKPLV